MVARNGDVLHSLLNLSVRLLDATKCFILKQAANKRSVTSANSSYAYHRHVRVTLPDESFEGVTRGMEPDVALRVEAPEGVMKSRGPAT